MHIAQGEGAWEEGGDARRRGLRRTASKMWAWGWNGSRGGQWGAVGAWNMKGHGQTMEARMRWGHRGAVRKTGYGIRDTG